MSIFLFQTMKFGPTVFFFFEDARMWVNVKFEATTKNSDFSAQLNQNKGIIN